MHGLLRRSTWAGLCVCRIAANEPSFLSGQLKVQDQRDKQKLNIKALDVVLFGPPTRMSKLFSSLSTPIKSPDSFIFHKL